MRITKLINWNIFFLILILFFPAIISSCKKNTAEHPNILIIFADDLGIKDLGITGSTYYETPNIDKLAMEGMQFTNAYASAANCAPSRACLMTGLQTPRHKIYTVANSDRGDTRTRRIIPVKNTTVLDTSFVTIAEELKKASYVTGIIGKWHLGNDPRQQGFDYFIGGGFGSPRTYFSPYRMKNLPDGPEGEYLTDRLTEEAMQFIETNKENRFFLFMSYHAVHTPLQCKEEIIEKYRNKPGSNGQNHAVYAAMIEVLDSNVGRLLHKLDDLDLTDNTLVIYTSDNGGIRSVSNQDPWRAGKGSYYEGGIRVPMFLKWPGVIDQNTFCDVPVTNMDFYPTLLDINHIDIVNDIPLDGLSLLPLISKNKDHDFADRELIWHFPIYLQAYNPQEDDGRDPLFRTRPGMVMRKGKWKIHEYFEDGGIELYDLASDPGERQNLLGSNPEKADELYRIMKEWRDYIKAPVPKEPNPEFDPE
ncbi:sulfatase [Bacteroidota bacterium]